MKIQCWSDLHNEFSVFTPPSDQPDLVILAGDIDIKARGVKWANAAFSCPVLYVCGNHEFYGGHIDHTLNKMKAAAAAHVHVLENECWVWNGIRFLGATGWTNFTTTGNVVAATRAARIDMNDFRVIRAESSYRRLRPGDVAAKNEATRVWLTQELAKPFEGKTVVITHHAPTPSVAGDKHDDHISAAYSNHWPDLISLAHLWIFGHTHHAVDVVLDGCRIISNPRGYPGEETGFNPGLEIEL